MTYNFKELDMKTIISIIIILLVFFYVKKFRKIGISAQKKALPKYILKRLSKDLGITETKCPYCGITLKKFPSRKTKCKNCKNFIYKRTRPIDGENILVTEKQIKQVDKEWSKRIFMGNYMGEDFEKYEKELQEIRKTDKIPFNDVVWYRYQQKYREACSKNDFEAIRFIHWEEGSFLFDEKRYKDALSQYLVNMYWNICGVGLILDIGKEEYFKYFFKPRIDFLGNPGRCIEYLNLTKDELEKMVLNMPIEEGFPFPCSIEDLLPYYLKAYDQHKQEKVKFEKEYNTRYLIGGKIGVTNDGF